MPLIYDEHEIRNIAKLFQKLMDRAKENDDKVSILYIEQARKIFDEGGYDNAKSF